MSEQTRSGEGPADAAPQPGRHPTTDPIAGTGEPPHDDAARPAAAREGYPEQFERRFQHLVDATDPQADAAADDQVARSAPVAVDDAEPVTERDTEPASEPVTEPDRRARRRRDLIRSVLIVAIVVLAAGVLRTFVVGHYYIPSASMEPTLHGCPGCNDDHVLVDKVSYRSHAPRAGDVIVFDRPPSDASGEKELIKRVIGAGGDTVVLHSGRVYVNGLLLDEPYVNKKCGSRPTSPLTGRAQWTIPRGDVFVLGDNRCNSFDSRAFGPIKDSSVVGRAFAIVWPLKRARLL